MHNFEDMLTFIALVNFFPLIIIIILMHVSNAGGALEGIVG